MAFRNLWKDRERHGEGRDTVGAEPRRRGAQERDDYRDDEERRRGARISSPEGKYYADDYRSREYREEGPRDWRRDAWREEEADCGGYARELEYVRRGAYGYGDYEEGTEGAEYGREEYGRGGREYGMQQNNRGRGPRGYRRSDERIREDVCDRLTEDPQIDASSMEVNVKDCTVTLSGTVGSCADKRRAEDIAADVSGVADVNNSLQISAELMSKERTGRAHH